MTTDLLLLSSQIALLVLVASVLSALIVWSWCRLGKISAQRLAAEQESKAKAAEQAAEAARSSQAAAEQQCVAAMEQRDEAERQALERSAESRRLTEQVANLQLNSITRTEHERLIAEVQQRLHDLETSSNARLDELRAALARVEDEHTQAIEQRDALTSKLTDTEQRLRDAETANNARIDELRAALARIEGEHTQAVEQRDALTATLNEAEQRLVNAQQASSTQVDELRATVTRLEHELTQATARCDDLLTQLATASQQKQSVEDELTQRLATIEREAQVKLDAVLADAQQKQRSLDDLASAKAAMEQELRARIAQLEATPPPAPATTPSKLLTPPPVRPAPLAPPPKPAPTPAPSAPAEDAFPMAPMAPARSSTLHHRLFGSAPSTVASPEAPQFTAARERLAQMRTDLATAQQASASAQSELASSRSVLDALHRDEPEAADKHRSAAKVVKETQHRAGAATEDVARLHRHIRALERSLAAIEAHPLRADDLTLIKGVKSVLNQQLHAHGIYTWRQIAAWDEEDITAFGELLSFKQRITRDKWQDQARQLHAAHYGERLMPQ